MDSMPVLHCDERRYEDAWRIALGDLYGNILPYRSGLLTQAEPCFMAGLAYRDPWTRDAAINTWNGGGLLYPAVAANTLTARLVDDGDGPVIGGQYWDAIIWACGAWHLYLVTGDRGFLAFALEVVTRSQARFEAAEFDADRHLFRGGACFMDGVAGYPDRYTNPDGHSGISGWSAQHPADRHPCGDGLPAMCLSTNCLHQHAYVLVDRMAVELGRNPVPGAAAKAAALKAAINEHLWDEDRGTYRYLVDDQGGCDRFEGLGLAFALLFGIADAEQARRVIASTPITAHGIACLWPQYERYSREGHYGRQCGTIWPQVNAFWCSALARHDAHAAAWREISLLTDKAVRDHHFAEIYHPDTGEVYGGLQERGTQGITLWRSLPRQTWCATGYLRMWLEGVFGCRWQTDGLALSPHLPPDLPAASLTDLPYRGATVDIHLGHGREATLDGAVIDAAHLPADLMGHHVLAIGVEGPVRDWYRQGDDPV